MLRVIIADDHLLIRVGLRNLLQDRFPGIHIAEADNGCTAVNLALEAHWDIIILDLAMPRRNGLEALKDIKYAKPSLPVLILSMHPEDEVAIRLLKAGASGFLNKECAAEELTAAIKKILSGGTYVSASLSEKLVQNVKGSADELPHATLSDREYEVLCMIGGGKTATQIADALSLSVKTVSTYRARILAKMNCTTTAELVRYAIEKNLMPVAV